jgi:DNA-binding PadR family transcriptional regulator
MEEPRVRDRTLTTLEYALLGLLDRQPRSGYDVARVFAGTPMAHFSSSPGAIYPALLRLERAGLVDARLDRATETRPRRVYTLTESGRSALVAWLRQPVTRQELVRDGRAPMLRFGLATSTPHQRLALDHGIRAYEGQLAWTVDAIRVLAQTLASSTGPEGEGPCT